MKFKIGKEKNKASNEATKRDETKNSEDEADAKPAPPASPVPDDKRQVSRDDLCRKSCTDDDSFSEEMEESEPVYAVLEKPGQAPQIVFTKSSVRRPNAPDPLQLNEKLLRGHEPTSPRSPGPLSPMRKSASCENLSQQRVLSPTSPGFGSADRLNRIQELCIRKDNPQFFVIYLDIRLYDPKNVVIGFKDGHVLIHAKNIRESRHGTEVFQLKRSYKVPHGTQSSELVPTIKEGLLKVERVIKNRLSLVVNRPLSGYSSS